MKERKETMGFLGILIGGILGALGMYLLDPNAGNRRRELLRDQMEKMRNQANTAVESAAEEVKDRAQDAAAEVQSRMQPSPVSDITLVSRVRSELGRASTHAAAIDVTSTNGIVVLSGHVLANEVERVLTTARNVPGVQNVENRMMVHDTPDGIPSLQSSERETRSTSGTGFQS